MRLLRRSIVQNVPIVSAGRSPSDMNFDFRVFVLGPHFL